MSMTSSNKPADTPSKELNEREELFHLIIESAPNAMILTNQEGRIVLVNAQVEALFGYDRQDLLGQMIEILVPERFRTHHKEYRHTYYHHPKTRLMGQGRDLYALHKNGKEIPVEIGLSAIPTSKELMVFSSIIDITFRKEAEHDLHEAIRVETANKAKSELLANMSHDIRTPINTITGNIELLFNTSLTNEQKEYLQTIYISGELLLLLINDILDFSKIESGAGTILHAPFQLTTLLEEVVTLLLVLAHNNNNSLTLEYQPNISPVLMGDQKRLKQILLNLISNAIKFTHNGSVIVRVKMITMLHAQQFILRFEVNDTGIGMTQEQQDIVFARFKQANDTIGTNYGGTGLGLAISKRLVELMGGTIGVKSDPGKGSCFWFELPFDIAEEKQLPAQAAPPTFQPILPILRGTILLVDDYPLNQHVARKILEKMGCAVDTADSGEEALAKLNERHYDIVLMDCQMPDMDGFETTRRIRENPKTTHNIVIAMTANALEEDRKHCIKAGMNDYISKPISSSQLEGVLKQYLLPE